jgi:BirA family transcriptional regulator, biotin operon repressor / biotin---[acetyl-CoA-carboxylase] ligase
MERIGQTLFSLNSVDSTNNYAMAQVHAGLAKHGTVYIADEQTAGRGQRGKTWLTDPGQNLIFSAVLQPPSFLFPHQFLLSAAVSLACYDLLNHITKNDTKIKWPNDLYWRDRKAGGILIESVIQGSAWRYAIAGIGINVNQTTFPDLVRAVSLRQITGRTWDIRLLVENLCNCLENRWTQLLSSNADGLMAQYNEVLFKRNEAARLRKENVVFEAIIKEVNKSGKLIASNGTEQEFANGEIEWVM